MKTPIQPEVLLIEDNDSDAEIVTSIFKKNKVNPIVHRSKTGEDALEILFPSSGYSEKPGIHMPNLILLDLNLPKINGLDVLKRMREQPVTNGIPVVIFTSSHDSTYAKESAQLGINCFVQKPTTYEKFEEALKPAEDILTHYNKPQVDSNPLTNTLSLTRPVSPPLYDALACGIFVLSKEDKTKFSVVSANRYFQNILNKPADKIIGKYVEDIFYKGSLQIIVAQCEKVFAENASVQWEETFTLGRQEHTLWIGISPLEEDNGKGIQLAGTVYDITQRIEAETTLQHKEQEWRTLFESIGEVFFSMNIVKNEIIEISPACKKVFGYSREELFDNPDLWQKCTHPEDMHLLAGEFEKLSAGETVICENRIITANKEVRWIRRKITPFMNENGNLIRVYGMASDITERKNAESEMEKTLTDLRRRNTALEEFSSIVSHNLRGPVTTIARATEMLMNDPLDEEVKALMLQGLNRSAQQLDNRIEDINGILQTNKAFSEVKEPVHLSKILNDVRAELNGPIRNTKTRIKTNFKDADALQSIPVYLHGIFHQLLSNSIKYMRPNTAPRIDVESRKMGNYLRISLKDNGMGFDQRANSDQVFHLYRRFHNHVEGKGIGLFIVKQHVDALGGKITVQSKVNQGAEFTIDLPI